MPEHGTRRCFWAPPTAAADASLQGPLYPQLRARRNGISRAEVVADQRARIYGAMVEAVSRHGYEAAPVATIARLAGVSTRTVYERFDSKEGCLLATCDAIARQAREKLSLACDAALAIGTHPLVFALEAFGNVIARHPKEAAFLLVHAPMAGPKAYEHVARAHALCAELLTVRLEQVEGARPSEQLVLGAIYGVSHVARVHLLDGEAEDACQRLGPLRGWALDCAAPAAAGLEPERACRLVGDHPVVERIGDGAWLASTRADGAIARSRGPGERESERLPRVAAEIAARDGYRAVNVARICEFAQIDVDDFFANFDGAEECLLAARELLSVEALASALRAIEREPRAADEWCDAVHSALLALLSRIADDPALQNVGFREPIGSEGVTRRVATMGRFAEVLVKRARFLDRFDSAEDGVARPTRLAPPLSNAVVGAFWGVVQDHVLRGEAWCLPRLAPSLAYLVLCPIVGPEQALATAHRSNRASVA